jgi:ribonuclease BN (tRNA processing enzyme)
VAADAGVTELMLTHLWPGHDPDPALAAARRGFAGPVTVARPGVTIDLGGQA